MREGKGNIFTIDCDAVVITTNGFVKVTGEAVMGRGCARQAAQMIPGLTHRLGQLLRRYGNRCMKLHQQSGVWLVSFPVKPVTKRCENPLDDVVRHMRHKFQPGDTIPGWACVADLGIIETSAHQLVEMADKFGWQRIAMPRPGCGAGELDWEHQVKPVLEGILDDRFTCYTF